MRLLFTFLIGFGLITLGEAQSEHGSIQNVKLIDYDFNSCDQTYDAYRIQNRISNKLEKNNFTYITVQFSDNCCFKFEPSIVFNSDSLFLHPYTEKQTNYCRCNCCFSITFKISGLGDQKYTTIFKGNVIVETEDFYRTQEPSYDSLDGERINETTKYGFEIGTWKDFYPNGNLMSEIVYPDTAIYYQPRDSWTKEYFESGQLAWFSTYDSFETWHENGILENREYRHHLNDTTFYYQLSRYPNNQLEKKSLSLSFPVHYGKADSDGTGYRRYFVHYDSLGNLIDSSYVRPTYTYYDDGRLKTAYFDGTWVEVNPNGGMKYYFRKNETPPISLGLIEGSWRIASTSFTDQEITTILIYCTNGNYINYFGEANEVNIIGNWKLKENNILLIEELDGSKQKYDVRAIDKDTLELKHHDSSDFIILKRHELDQVDSYCEKITR